MEGSRRSISCEVWRLCDHAALQLTGSIGISNRQLLKRGSASVSGLGGGGSMFDVEVLEGTDATPGIACSFGDVVPYALVFTNGDE